MLGLDSTIAQIETLLRQNTEASLTYAALECRLAIERICYERLRVAHDYISHDDIKKWQPRAIVKTLIEEVDTKSATGFTLSISRFPQKEGSGPPTREDYDSMEFIPIGTQTGFDPKKLGELWNALANLALHIELPKTKSDVVSQYGNSELIRSKVEEALHEIRRIGSGTLISTGFGEEISFVCKCGQNNKRRLGLLKDDQVVSCINPKCDESYDYEKENALFGRRIFTLSCRNCKSLQDIPKRMLEKLRIDQHIFFDCAGCGDRIYVSYRPMQAQKMSKSE